MLPSQSSPALLTPRQCFLKMPALWAAHGGAIEPDIDSNGGANLAGSLSGTPRGACTETTDDTQRKKQLLSSHRGPLMQVCLGVSATDIPIPLVTSNLSFTQVKPAHRNVCVPVGLRLYFKDLQSSVCP